MAEIRYFKQFFSKDSLYEIYDVMAINNVDLEDFSKETIEKVSYMEKYYQVNERQVRFYENLEDDIPPNQMAYF